MLMIQLLFLISCCMNGMIHQSSTFVMKKCDAQIMNEIRNVSYY